MTTSGPPSYTSRAGSQAEHDHLYSKKSSKPEREDSDKRSIKSRSSQASRGSRTVDALVHIAGESVRHAKCAPEFLEEISKKNTVEGLEKVTSSKFKIITGTEASTFFKKFLGDSDEPNENRMEEKREKRDEKAYKVDKYSSSPVVFAVSVWDAGRRCVDYYMTWRGKTRARHLKGSERRTGLLDSEFRRVARTLDKEYKKTSLQGSPTSDKPSSRRKDEDRKETSTRKPRLPAIVVSPVEETANSENASEGNLSAMSSVVSLPLLNMIRGVPLGNRLPLRVTNPDRLSMISNSDSVLDLSPNSTTTTPDSAQRRSPLETVVEDAETPATSPEGQPSPETLTVPAVVNTSVSSDSSLDTLPPSVASSDHSSRSSRSHRSSHGDRKHHHHSHSHRHDDSSRDRDSSRRHDRKHHDDDLSRRRHKSSSEDTSAEFLIVLLGDELDRDFSWHGMGNTSLQRHASAKSLMRAPSSRHSPWSGPLARADGITYHHPPSRSPSIESESESSDDEGGWKNSPVIPMKPMMEAMGLIPSEASYYHQSPLIPSGIQYQLSIGTPISGTSPYNSPYLYSSPRLAPSSPYVPAWVAQQSPNTPISTTRLSGVYAASTGYPSPYVQTQPAPY